MRTNYEVSHVQGREKGLPACTATCGHSDLGPLMYIKQAKCLGNLQHHFSNYLQPLRFCAFPADRRGGGACCIVRVGMSWGQPLTVLAVRLAGWGSN